MLRSLLDEAVASAKATRLRIIQELAMQPDQILPEIVQTSRQIGTRLSILLRVLRTIGYPANAPAIPWLMAHVGPNLGAWKDTVKTFAELDPEICIPYLVQRFLESSPQPDARAIAIEDFCPLLLALDVRFAAGCGPTIAYLLATNAYPEDPTMLLNVLDKVGPASAPYALPVLIDLAQYCTSRDAVEQARRMIAGFEVEDVKPYRFLVAAPSQLDQ